MCNWRVKFIWIELRGPTLQFNRPIFEVPDSSGQKSFLFQVINDMNDVIASA